MLYFQLLQYLFDFKNHGDWLKCNKRRKVSSDSGSDASRRDVARPPRVTWSASRVNQEIMCCSERRGSRGWAYVPFSTMAASKNSSFSALFIALLLSGGAVVPSYGLDLPGLLDKGDETSSAGLSVGAADKLAVFKTWPGLSVSLLSSFPEDVEMSDYCREMLRIFGQRYIAYADCLVSAARPVKVCQSCLSEYVNLNDTYQNISSNQVCTRPPSHSGCFAVTGWYFHRPLSGQPLSRDPWSCDARTDRSRREVVLLHFLFPLGI